MAWARAPKALVMTFVEHTDYSLPEEALACGQLGGHVSRVSHKLWCAMQRLRVPKLPVPIYLSFCPSKICTRHFTVVTGYGRLPTVTSVGSSSSARLQVSAPYAVAGRVHVSRLGGVAWRLTWRPTGIFLFRSLKRPDRSMAV